MQNIPSVAGYNASAIGGYPNKGKAETGVKEENAKSQGQEQAANSMNPDDVWKFLGANGASALATTKGVEAPKGVVKISDYVDAESAARIAEFLTTDFEPEMVERFNAWQEEFPDMPEDIAMNYAVTGYELDHNKD